MDTSVRFNNTSHYINNKESTSEGSNLSAKLRRLKIEESILMQSLFNFNPMYSQNISDAYSNNYSLRTEFKKFFDDTKTTFNTLKILFQDIKAKTSSKEVIESLGKYKVFREGPLSVGKSAKPAALFVQLNKIEVSLRNFNLTNFY